MVVWWLFRFEKKLDHWRYLIEAINFEAKPDAWSQPFFKMMLCNDTPKQVYPVDSGLDPTDNHWLQTGY